MQFRHWLHRIYSGPRQHRLFKQSHRRYGRRQQVFQGRKRSRRLCKKSGQFQKNKHKKSIGLYNKKTWKKPPSISLYRRIRLPPCLRILQIFPVHDLPPYQLFHAKTRKIKHHPSTDGLFFCRKPSIFLGHIVFILFPFRAIRHKLRFWPIILRKKQKWLSFACLFLSPKVQKYLLGPPNTMPNAL